MDIHTTFSPEILTTTAVFRSLGVYIQQADVPAAILSDDVPGPVLIPWSSVTYIVASADEFTSAGLGIL